MNPFKIIAIAYVLLVICIIPAVGQQCSEGQSGSGSGPSGGGMEISIISTGYTPIIGGAPTIKPYDEYWIPRGMPSSGAPISMTPTTDVIIEGNEPPGPQPTEMRAIPDKPIAFEPGRAVVFVSNAVTPYEHLFIANKINKVCNFLKKQGYNPVELLGARTEEIIVEVPWADRQPILRIVGGDVKDFINIITDPNKETRPKAIAYFGHGSPADPTVSDPNMRELIEGDVSAVEIKQQYLTNSGISKKNAEKLAEKAQINLNMKFVYMHTCDSLNNGRLRDVLTAKDGTYYGKDGSLNALEPLHESHPGDPMPFHGDTGPNPGFNGNRQANMYEEKIDRYLGQNNE